MREGGAGDVSEGSKSLAVEPQKLIEYAELLGRHQQSWSQLLAGQRPEIAAGAFGEGLSAQGHRIERVLAQLHELRQRQSEQVAAEARAASKLARDAEDADHSAAGAIAEVLR